MTFAEAAAYNPPSFQVYWFVLMPGHYPSPSLSGIDNHIRTWSRKPHAWVAIWAIYALGVLAYFAREDALAGLMCIAS